ncbi:Hydroquinone glucosyltransferase, putative [Theobroma cacao]|uniref:Hydroquinone glucosyltransferase, putative n=1 Tax=Theobroma cacao TaxID=3641 RepID=A0A061E0I6_THECC|nr:Hydroquinone glucosyltransferase, putative [Theobroma cacao]
MLPTPGMGQLIPLVEFDKDLVHSHDWTVTLIVLTMSTKGQTDLLGALNHSIPPVSSDPETRVSIAIRRSVFTSPCVQVIAMSLALMFALPRLDETVSRDFMDLPEPLKLPGSIPVHETIEALQQREPNKPPVYAIGPRLQTGSSGGVDESQCLKWLDDQPSSSACFIWQRGTLSFDQLTELALGLEMKRFPDRTKGKGLVLPSWAPQKETLGHGSTGGFLTHCGWNSVLESIANGVPMIAWPLYAEQRMNAVLLADGINVALRPKVNQNGLVEREEIEVVKSLIKGEEGMIIREEMNKCKAAAAKAVTEGGSSTKSLSQLVLRWKSQKSI